MGVAYVDSIAQFDGQEATIRGWLYNKRSIGKLHFLLVRDGTGIIQCVVSKADVPEGDFEACHQLTQESSLMVTGTVHADKRAPGGYEVIAKSVQVVSIAHEYPITPKEHGTTFLMDHRHLWLRSSRQHAIMRIRHEIVRSIRDFFDDRGFTLIDPPILTPAACEGTTTLFEVNYFGEKVYLSQSGQLYGEAGAMAFGKIYTFGPTFRAEKSKTRRHLTEFWMIEPEMAYYDLNDNMNLAEEFIEYIVQRVLDTKKNELEIIERNTTYLSKVRRPFPRISYDEAVALLRQKNIEFEWGNDFGGPDETVISENFDRPVIVHRFPSKIKAFYMKRDPENENLALGCDVLAPEGYGEIIGGAQREDSLELLEERIAEHKLPKEAFEWYLDLRRYGSVPHSGFGMGLERVVAWICGLEHVRETIPFPRMLYRITP